MRNLLILFVLLLMFKQAFGYPLKPNPEISPGHMCTIYDPDFSEYRYHEKIPYCRRNVSSQTKNKIYYIYQIPQSEKTDYTIDHIIPLSIGGSNNPKNLWSEHKKVKATRPDLEYDVYIDLKDGRISQQEAVKIILDEKFKN